MNIETRTGRIDLRLTRAGLNLCQQGVARLQSECLSNQAIAIMHQIETEAVLRLMLGIKPADSLKLDRPALRWQRA